MTISPVGLNPASAAASSVSNVSQSAVTANSDQVAVKFAPSNGAASPLEQVGSSVMDKLKDFEASRANRNAAMHQIHAGPASAVDTAKADLLAGPASQSMKPLDGSAAAGGANQPDRAITAMTRTFDYAIETQLIVKTGSQLSTSASSLMRGQ